MKSYNILVKHMSFFAVLMILLTGCSMEKPIKNQLKPVTGPAVTYSLKKKPDIYALQFNEDIKTKKNQNLNEKWGIKVTRSRSKIKVNKFVSNGMAGSENEYSVRVDTKGKSITLTPTLNRQHQDGLVMPMAIPNFNINQLLDFLSSTRHEFSFEVKSKYSSESVNGNFKRLLSKKSLRTFNSSGEKIYGSIYALDVPGAESKILVKTFPYQNGSRSEIKVIYYTKRYKDQKIIISEIEKRIKEKVTKIVKA